MQRPESRHAVPRRAEILPCAALDAAVSNFTTVRTAGIKAEFTIGASA